MKKKYSPGDGSADERQPFYWIVTAAVLAVLILITFCVLMLIRDYGNKKAQEPVSSVAASSEAVSSAMSASAAASVVSDTASSGASASSDPVVSGSGSTASATVSPSGTAQPFEENSIDRGLNSQMAAVNTITDAVGVYNRQIELWKTELKREVSELSKYQKDTEASQKSWETASAARIATMEAQCESAGGSSASLDLAEFIYREYQSRGKELYQQIVGYNSGYVI